MKTEIVNFDLVPSAVVRIEESATVRKAVLAVRGNVVCVATQKVTDGKPEKMSVAVNELDGDYGYFSEITYCMGHFSALIGKWNRGR